MNKFVLNYFSSVFVLIFLYYQVSNALEFRYHKNEELEDVLRNFTVRSGKVRTQLTSIGNSSHREHPRPLWVLEMTAAEENKIGVPNVKLLGNMHGNEAGGREILLHFIEFLIDNYGKMDQVTWLLDNTRIHVLPSLNPDGFEIAARTCNGYTGRDVPFPDVDLNRCFPDFFEDNSKLLARINVKESAAVVAWMNKTPFILSAALHGGQLVANYPFDSARRNPKTHQESPTPDDEEFKYLAKKYSFNHPTMHLGKANCKGSDFWSKDGITNGAKWYAFNGGMGDYNYAFHGCMELTLEISCCKYPKERQLKALWNENKKSLLTYCMQANMGVTGQILDFDTRRPIERAQLHIVGRYMAFWSANRTGEFWRILLPGDYQLKVEAMGYHTHTENFTVPENSSEYPKLTFLTVLLYNSSTYTTTSSTQRTTTTTELSTAMPSTTSIPSTTTIPRATDVPQLLSPRMSEIDIPILDMAVKSSSNERNKNLFFIGTIFLVNIF